MQTNNNKVLESLRRNEEFAVVEELLLEYFQIKQLTPRLLEQLLRSLTEYHMTYKEIARCLVWNEEVRHGKWDLVYGISFIWNVREAANKYFDNLPKPEEKEEEAKKFVDYQDKNIIIFHIKDFHPEIKKRKQLDITEIDISDDN